MADMTRTDLGNGMIARVKKEKHPAFRMVHILKQSGDIVAVRRDRFHAEWQEERDACGELVVDQHISAAPGATKVRLIRFDPASGNMVHDDRGRPVVDEIGVDKEFAKVMQERQAATRARAEESSIAFNAKDRQAAAMASHAGAAAAAAVVQAMKKE